MKRLLSCVSPCYLGKVEVKNRHIQTELVETKTQHVQAGKLLHQQSESFNFPYGKFSELHAMTVILHDCFTMPLRQRRGESTACSVLTHRNTDKSAQVEHTTKDAVHLCTLVSYNENTRGILEI